jgi:AraC-like DNA-binding protein
MPGSGTRTFLDLEQYEASLRRAQIGVVIVPRLGFGARLVWAELHQLLLLRCDEEFPRIGFLSSPPRLATVTFCERSSSTPVWRGTKMQAGDIMFHSLGERLHQATAGPSVWSVIALDPAWLDEYGRIFAERPISPPPKGQILRPSPSDAARLRRLHAQACRLAQTKSGILAHPEVSRAIEQDLIPALVTCLTAAKIQEIGTAERNHARIMIRFEEVLAAHLGQPLHMPDLCELIGVTGRTLRSCCAEFIGISPQRYMLLRRLKQVRAALFDADPGTASVAELARHHGFTQLGRFAGIYRAVFGEPPSTTLGRVPQARFTDP